MVRTPPRWVRDLAWAGAGIGGVVGAVRVMERLRPEPLADSWEAPENRGVEELARAYRLAGLAIAAGPVSGTARLPAVCGPAGIGVLLAGFGLRVWSMRTLRGHYTRGLRAVAEQPVITTGPYRLVRHPGYLGSMLLWLGAALASRRLAGLGVTALIVGTAYGHRMDAEEALLRRELPGYAAYAARTGRLVPRRR